MEQGQAFRAGEFLGSVIVYIFLGLIIFSVIKIIFNKIRKKDASDNLEDIKHQKPSKRSRILKVLIIAVIIGFIAILFISIAFYLTSDETDSKGWTYSTKSSFKEGILSTCGTKATELCSCTADYLIERYSLEELSKLQNLTLESDKPPQEFLDAAHACLSDS
ncbi:hypothetical protein HYU92_03630 [Candidatus Curtissbacteria bacterium]|nr:hypothetical protein [Candidatus Curtissbacteria bacterium]